MKPLSQVKDAATNGLDASIESLYRHRFPRDMLNRRAAVWRVLCSSWFASSSANFRNVSGLFLILFLEHKRLRDAADVTTASVPTQSELED
jgi:hypothetical protein